MRVIKLLSTSLTILLVLCAPALAQSAPAASQYRAAAACPAGDEPQGDQAQTASADDGACASANNAGQGTAAVNEALSGASASASAPAESSPGSAVAESAEPESDPGEDAAAASAEAGDGGGLASITELPETGGISPTTLVLGVLLVVAGLIVRKVVGE